MVLVLAGSQKIPHRVVQVSKSCFLLSFSIWTSPRKLCGQVFYSLVHSETQQGSQLFGSKITFFFFGPTGQYIWRPLATTPERLTVWQSAGKHQFNEARLWLPLNARRLLSCWDGESETGQLTGSAPSIHQWLSHQINGLRVVRATKLLSSELQRSAELYTESKVERRDR